jgi:hypothetical protein
MKVYGQKPMRWSRKTGQCDWLNPILRPIWLPMIHGMIHKTKGKSFFVVVSVPPENKNSRLRIHMVTVKAHGICLVVQSRKIKWTGK